MCAQKALPAWKWVTSCSCTLSTEPNSCFSDSSDSLNSLNSLNSMKVPLHLEKTPLFLCHQVWMVSLATMQPISLFHSWRQKIKIKSASLSSSVKGPLIFKFWICLCYIFSFNCLLSTLDTLRMTSPKTDILICFLLSIVLTRNENTNAAERCIIS